MMHKIKPLVCLIKLDFTRYLLHSYKNILTPIGHSFPDIVSPEGVAVDPISRRIYWTDSTKDTIEVASLDNPHLRAVVVKTNLVNPRGIAVDPHNT